MKIKTHLLVGTAMLVATSLLAAEAKDEVTSAAKKLASSDGYSWKSTTENAGGGGGGGGGGGARGRVGPTEGKAAKDGTIMLSMTRGENTTEAVIKGEKGAIKTQDGWKSLSDASEGDGQNPARFAAMMLRNYKAPAEEAQDLASKATGLKKDGDAILGELSADAVKALLSRGRRPGGNAPEATGSKVSVKFWVKDGTLSKYEYNVKGTVSFNNNDREVNRTTVVEIKDVGKTKVDVPEATPGDLPNSPAPMPDSGSCVRSRCTSAWGRPIARDR